MIVLRTRLKFPVGLPAIMIGLAFAVSLRAEESVKQSFDSIPDQFFQIQDSFGFFWKAAPNGALTSGETQYLQSGLKLLVDGVAFTPTSGSQIVPGKVSDEASLSLEEEREGVEIVRDLWFDKERGGIRVIDQIKNTSGAAISMRVQLRTTYPFGWKSLHGSDGIQLNAEPVLSLAKSDGGLSVRFGPSEGRPDTLILTSDGGVASQPTIEASANRRELTLTYELALSPGGTAALLHWMLQRSLAETTETAAALSDFWQRGKLIRPGVSASLASEFVNFDPDAFPSETVAPSRLRSLIALNELIDRVGIHRRSEELLWISTVNQVAGSVDVTGNIQFEAGHLGSQEVALANVAAIKGGGGFGRSQMVYLRNGAVLSGVGGETRLLLSLGEGEAQEIDLKLLNLLLFRISMSDGAPPENAEVFVELRDGSVFALSGAEGVYLSGNTAWGELEIPLSEIVEVGYEVKPSAQMGIRLKNGSRLSVFLRDRPLPLTLSSGENVEVSSLSLRRLWTANAEIFKGSENSSEWIELSEVTGDIPDSAFLLVGNNVVAGTFRDSSVNLSVEGSLMRLPVEQIVRMRRSIAEGGEMGAEFIVELANGDAVVGEVTSGFVELEASEVDRVPVHHLLDFQRKAAQSD